jgi:hypothetical protein
MASKRTASQKMAGLGDERASGEAGETLQPMEQFMTQMFRLVSEMTEKQQRAASEERAVERARQEEERKRLAELNATNMMEQLREVIMLVGEKRDSGRRATGTAVEPKIARLSDADYIEAYLTTLERLMNVDSVDRATWAVRLASHLTGKAQQAFAAMRETEATDYDKVKEAILRRYNVSQETYRQRFRSVRRKEEESYAELVVRLEDLLHK